MHELSLVADLVEVCQRRAHGRQVVRVRVRRPANLGEAELRQAFAMLTAMTELSDAILDVDTNPAELACPCGFAGPLEPENIIGHLVVCPVCARVGSARPSALELLEVCTADAPAQTEELPSTDEPTS